MIVLVLNAGSSSIKYELFDMLTRKPLATGMVERIGEEEGRLVQHHSSGGAKHEILREGVIGDHRLGFTWMAEALRESTTIQSNKELSAVGHRVVHGGETFSEPVRIDQDVLMRIREQIPLAPLHNPANLLGIEVALEAIPEVPHVAVFDTAFHHSIPAHAHRYALPQEQYENHRIRRYGFHGTSHFFVAKQAARHLHRPLDKLNMITLHLGNGASAAAIANGRSIDTSMGMTPLEGLVMGTRCGDLDPAIIFYLARETGMDNDAIESMLNRKSGLKGICGVNDMREALRRADEGDESAALAIDIYAYRIKKYIGAYCAVLGRIDAIIFTAGIGENSPDIRLRACSNLSALGIAIDTSRNAATANGIREIQSADSRVRVLVVPTDEELEIADEAIECINTLQEST